MAFDSVTAAEDLLFTLQTVTKPSAALSLEKGDAGE
jgi:hypothetical protein